MTRHLFSTLVCFLFWLISSAVYAGNHPATPSVQQGQGVTACDTLVFLDGTTAVVRLVAVRDHEVVYQPCQGGPEMSLQPGSIRAIHYASGTVQETSSPQKGESRAVKKESNRGYTAFALAIAAVVTGLFPLAFVALGMSIHYLRRNPREVADPTAHTLAKVAFWVSLVYSLLALLMLGLLLAFVFLL